MGLVLRAFPIGIAGTRGRVFRIRFDGDSQDLAKILKALMKVLPIAEPDDGLRMIEIYEAFLKPLGLVIESCDPRAKRYEGEIVVYITRKLLQLAYAFKLGYETALREVEKGGQ